MTGSLHVGRGDHKGRDGFHDGLRLVEHPGGRRAALRLGTRNHARGAAQLAAAPADPHDLGVDKVFGRGTTPGEVASYLVHALIPEETAA